MKTYFFQFIRKKLNVMSDEFVEKHRRYKLKMFLSTKDKEEVEKFIQKCKEEWNNG
ncbi:MAG: hypothetical protein RSB50_06165 [Cetobacterium sp.]